MARGGTLLERADAIRELCSRVAHCGHGRLVRIEAVAAEAVDLALTSPNSEAFLQLARRWHQPSTVPSVGDTGATSSDQEPKQSEKDPLAAIRESAEKFISSVKETVAGFGGSLPPRANTAETAQTPEKKAGDVWRGLDSLAKEFVVAAGDEFRTPDDNSSAGRFIKVIESARTREDFQKLKAGTPPWVDPARSLISTQEALERVRKAIPETAVQAWCEINFVDSRAIFGKDKIETIRNELIDSLSGHKKEEERPRPIKFWLAGPPPPYLRLRTQ